jgi:glycosyltransferase involved in cell wall biosynthesis
VRVLSVIHNPVYGGAHNELLGQRAGLADAGWETVAVLADEQGSSGETRLRAAAVEVETLPLARLRATARPGPHVALATGFAPQVRDLRRLIRAHRADLVQVHGAINPHGAVAARLERVAVCWHLYDMVAPAPLRRALSPAVVRLADSVTAIGRALAHAHPGVERLGERLVITSPPADLERFAPDPARRAAARAELGVADGAVVIGTVGNLFPNKGHLHLLDAAGRLPGATVRLLGGPSAAHGDYERAVRARAGAALVDPGTRVSDLLPAFDVFVMPSLSEGMPTTILEAMGCGLPVVASDVGAVAELVADGVTGSLVAPADPAALAAALARLVGDPARRAAMGAAGRERALARFSTAQVVANRLRAYELALEHRRARARR